MFAQRAPITDFGHFKIENSDLIYQHVIDTTISPNAALKYLRSLPGTHKVQLVDDFITAEFENLVVDARRVGRNWFMTPAIIENYKLSGKLLLEFKEKRYRLTLSGMFFVAATDSVRKLGEGTFADNMLKRDKDSIRPTLATEDVLGIYDLFFTDYFLIKRTSITRSDW